MHVRVVARILLTWLEFTGHIRDVHAHMYAHVQLYMCMSARALYCAVHYAPCMCVGLCPESRMLEFIMPMRSRSRRGGRVKNASSKGASS